MGGGKKHLASSSAYMTDSLGTLLPDKKKTKQTNIFSL